MCFPYEREKKSNIVDLIVAFEEEGRKNTILVGILEVRSFIYATLMQPENAENV